MGKNNERLFEIVSPIVSEYGMRLTAASFCASKEFQGYWRRSGDDVDVKISDYLTDAPDAVIEDFSRTVIGTTAGRKPVYGSIYLEWVRSDGYINSKRRIYLKRSRNLTGSHEGRERSLLDSLDRLLDSGLLDPESIENSVFSWTRTPNVRKVGFCSPMMRVVGVSCALDDPSVPEFVLDYVVYHEALHLAQGYMPGQRPHSKKFRAAERKYPKYEEAERFLRTLKASPE